MPESADDNNFLRLRSAGISAEDAIDIAKDSAFAFDRNRKPFGSPSGALGTTGLELYEKLIEDPSTFLEFQPFTNDGIAEKLCRSKGAIGGAVRRLIEHGFLEKRREGRSFAVRTLIPSLALTEGAERYLEPSDPGTLWHDHYRPLGKIVLQLFPRE